MKVHIHPPYRTVVFHDTSANEYFKVGSTIRTDRVIELDGETFPYVTIDVSSKSHPYYTGKQKTFANEAVQPDSASASAALLMRKGKHDAGRQLIT